MSERFGSSGITSGRFGTLPDSYMSPPDTSNHIRPLPDTLGYFDVTSGHLILNTDQISSLDQIRSKKN